MYTAVPTPNVSVTVLQNAMMMVGQPLILECMVTTVRGINSQVDIVWRNINSDEELRNTSIAIFNSSSVPYRDYLNISQVTTDDNDVTYQCEVTINAYPPVMEIDTVALHVNGKYLSYFNYNYYMYMYSLQFQIL